MSETDADVDTRRKKRPRSPSYPAIDLSEAIDRARVMYEHESRHAAPFEAILEHWGYSPRSGAGSVVLAALRKYGLLDYEGKNARLSDAALHIIWDENDSDQRRELIKQAALTPSIYKELWEQYRGNLPSDTTMRLELRRRGFAESAIPEAIESFRRTLEFAGLTDGDSMVDTHADKTTASPAGAVSTSALLQSPPLARAPHAPTPGPPSIQFPLIGGTVVTINASGPVSEDAWNQMMAVLAALKSGFVTPPEPARQRDSDDED